MKSTSLRSSRDFADVARRGRSGRSGPLQVVALARVDPAAPARLGLAVRAETAVTRNRARRRVRAAWATQTPQGWDVVVKGSGSLATLNFQDLEGHLAKALSQAGAA